MYKAPGAPVDLLREHLTLNQSGNFSTTANIDSDVLRETAITSGMPARTGHVSDATAFATQPKEADWTHRLREGWIPAKTTASGSSGSLT